MSKVRIYDLAKELKLESKKVLEDARRMGVDVSVPSHTLDDNIAAKIREMYYPEKKQPAPLPKARLIKLQNSSVLPETPEGTSLSEHELLTTPADGVTQASADSPDGNENESDTIPLGIQVSQTTESTSPAPEIVTVNVQTPVFLTLNRPQNNNKVRILVSSDTVMLEYGGNTYLSPNKIDQSSLDELSPKEYGKAIFNGIIHEAAWEGYGSTLSGYHKVKEAIDNAKEISFELLLDPAVLKELDSAELWGKETETAQEPESLALHTLNWEYLCEPDKESPLSINEQYPFYRREGSREKPETTVAKPIKVLVAICNPVTLGREDNSYLRDLPPLNPALQREIVENGLKRLKKAGMADYTILQSAPDTPVTLETLKQELEEGYHILHILAHGSFIDKVGQYCLIMESPDGKHSFEPATRFEPLARTKDLRLIVLAACQSGKYRAGHALQGLGPRLVKLGIPAVVAMQDDAPVEMVQLFTQHFYDDLARSGRVDKAMAATRSALYDWARRKRNNDWGIPVLLMSTDDGYLFEVDEKKASMLEELKPEIKSYDQLPGGDPRPHWLEKRLSHFLRDLGVAPITIGNLNVVSNALLNGLALRSDTKPLAQRQDRKGLSNRITEQVRFVSDDLRQYIEANGNGLKLSSTVYRQIASALNTGKHIIFIGPPGTGKTTLAHKICEYAVERKFAAGIATTTATADWSTFDTVGGYVPTAQQELQFRPGIFMRAISEGHWLVIDEINRAEIDKAFGELFTALSGQRVDLPYRVGEEQVRLLPANGEDPQNWESADAIGDYDYVIHPNWRILAAMNVYDKSYLFSLSFAFMRRFAFIDIGLPSYEHYRELIEQWIAERNLPIDETGAKMRKILLDLLAPESELSKHRQLGPALLKDIINYVSDRYKHGDGSDLCNLLCEAFLLYVAPQLDGLEREAVFEIYGQLLQLFQEVDELPSVLMRIRQLYPHIPHSEWQKTGIGALIKRE
jgi:MoxR-like ATPase